MKSLLSLQPRQNLANLQAPQSVSSPQSTSSGPDDREQKVQRSKTRSSFPASLSTGKMSMTLPAISSDFFFFSFLAFLLSLCLEALLKLRLERWNIHWLLESDFIVHVRPYVRSMYAALTASAAVVIQTVSSRNISDIFCNASTCRLTSLFSLQDMSAGDTER